MKLYGKNAVMERIKTHPESIQQLYLQKRVDLSEIVISAKKADIKFESVDDIWIKRECRSMHTQGVLALVTEYEYAPLNLLFNECKKNISIPIFLDGVTDPQNLGAIIRNIACLGGFSLVLPEYNSVCVNETVLHVASGGENYIKIAKVSNIATAIKKIKKEGIRIIGAYTGKSESIRDAELFFPMAVVFGSEGKGIRPGVDKTLDAKLSLAMNGAPLSYNVAVAVALFCYEINRKLL